MARLLFVQPSLQPTGGGNGVAAWMLQTLADRHDVTLLTCAPFEPRATDDFFGTGLAARRIAHRLVATWWRPVLEAAPVPLHLLRDALLLRHVRRLEASVDLVVSANNEWPLHGTGVSYVHYPSRARPRPEVDMRWYHRAGPLALYYAVSDRLAAFDAADVRRQVLLANSEWTAAHLRRVHGVDARTVYPPIAGTFVVRGFEEREARVLCVGRFSPEKAFERAVAIVDALRGRGHALALTIVGSPGMPAYERRIRALAADRAWLDVRSGLSRAALLALMSRCRFGLHAMVDEHFGMAPAEMVEAGCLTFVHRSGGQTEIVRRDDLSWIDVPDAVARIERALLDDAHRQRLLVHVAGLRGRFTPATFCARVDAIVDETLALRTRR
ncbi:MAG: glycosyltransferase family 4 protein [bacterium]|nr:glycosyltransferase family 4 protein [bacterium]